MNLSSYVAGLREKPEHVRKRASFWWALSITLVIALGYVASFEFRNTNTETQASAAAAAETISSPGGSMMAAVGNLAGSVWSRIVGTKTVTYSEVEVVPGKN